MTSKVNMRDDQNIPPENSGRHDGIKKKGTWSTLLGYAGKWKWMIWVSLLLSAVSTALGTAPYLYMYSIIDEIIRPAPDTGQLIVFAWNVVLFSVISVSVYFIAITLSHLFAFHIESGIREKSMERFFTLPLGFFKQEASGKLRKTIDENATLTHNLMAHHTPDFAGLAIFPIIMIIVFFNYDWRLGLISLFSLLSSLIFMLPMYSGKNRDCVKQNMDAQEQMNAAAVEYVRGIPVVKIFQQTVYSFKAFRDAVKNYAKFAMDYTVMARKWMVLSTLAGNIAVILLSIAGILWIGWGGDVQYIVAHILFYILFATFCSSQVMRLMQAAQSVFQANEVVERLEQLYTHEPMVYGSQQAAAKCSIDFEGVSFAYPNMKQNALSDITLQIPQGSTVALVGESGGGKSTLVSLLPRFYDPQKGRITIGGIDVRDFSQIALMQQISFVFQNQHLFKESVLENVRKSRLGASEEQVMEACRKMQCADIIERLPEGLHTVVGGRGVFLSGGEEQRLLLARAYLKDAPVLVLDEATAFADLENEHLIQKAFKELGKNKTVLMIAHRLSTVVDADKIVVLEQGRIVEEGNHQSLLEENGSYSRMWQDYISAASWRFEDRGGVQ